MATTTNEIDLTTLSQHDETAALLLRIASKDQPEIQRNIVVGKVYQEWQANNEWHILQVDALPEEFSGFAPPDIVAKSRAEGILAIGQIETTSTVLTEDTIARWRRFGSIAPITFYIFIPQGFEKPCYHILKQYGISATLATYGFDERFNPMIEPSE